MLNILQSPEIFFDFNASEINSVSKEKIKALTKNKLANKDNYHEIDECFIANYKLYCCALSYGYHLPLKEQLKKPQRKAITFLQEQSSPRLLKIAKKLCSSNASVLIGGSVMYEVSNSYSGDYFNLFDGTQLEYLCAEGEIRARVEASRLLLKVINETLKSRPEKVPSEPLIQEIKTLKASLSLERLLSKWRNLYDEASPQLSSDHSELEELESKIKEIAAQARTHKLIKRFYPNEAIYEICREWNEKRIVPIPQDVQKQIKKLSSTKEKT